MQIVSVKDKMNANATKQANLSEQEVSHLIWLEDFTEKNPTDEDQAQELVILYAVRMIRN